MKYLGSKRRVAGQLASVVNSIRRERTLFEPFCGGLNATKALGGKIIASDSNRSLITLYQRVQQYGVDWLPTVVTEQEREEALQLPDTDPLKAYRRIAAGFCGDWFGGYAKEHPKNDWVAQTRNSLNSTRNLDVVFFCLDFLQIEPSAGEILYLDPPYRNTIGYAQPFDYDQFVRCAQSWADMGSDVFVSEYAFPQGFQVWEQPLKAMGDRKTGAVERLFYMGPACR